MIILGSHCSMKAPKYLLGSIEDAISYKADACMVYTGAPSNSKRKETEALKIEEAHRLMKRHGIDPKNLIIHAPYIINLANSVKPETAAFGIEFLRKEIERVHDFGAQTIVLHPGSHVGAGIETGLEWIIHGLNKVLDTDEHNVNIALETMAGKGKECGYTFEQLALIKAGVHKQDRICICLDTCHIHDAGYDLANLNAVFNEFDRILGLDHLAVVHVNDSKNECGARKDRHENIGSGCIGFDTLYKVVHHPRLDGIPMILETPWIHGKAPYKEEIQKLRCGLHTDSHRQMF